MTIDSKTDEQIASENLLLNDVNDAEMESLKTPEIDSIHINQNLAGLLSLIPIGFGLMKYKTAAAVWTQDVCEGVANAALPVLKKYAWGHKVIDFLETGGGVEELGLMAVITPVIFTTMKAIENDKQKLLESQDNPLPPIDMSNDYDARN